MVLTNKSLNLIMLTQTRVLVNDFTPKVLMLNREEGLRYVGK